MTEFFIIGGRACEALRDDSKFKPYSIDSLKAAAKEINNDGGFLYSTEDKTHEETISMAIGETDYEKITKAVYLFIGLCVNPHDFHKKVVNYLQARDVETELWGKVCKLFDDKTIKLDFGFSKMGWGEKIYQSYYLPEAYYCLDIK